MATFTWTEAIRVEIMQEPGETAVHRFLRWCLTEDLYAFRSGFTSPTMHVGYYPATHKAQICAWLKENVK